MITDDIVLPPLPPSCEHVAGFPANNDQLKVEVIRDPFAGRKTVFPFHASEVGMHENPGAGMPYFVKVAAHPEGAGLAVFATADTDGHGGRGREHCLDFASD